MRKCSVGYKEKLPINVFVCKLKFKITFTIIIVSVITSSRASEGIQCQEAKEMLNVYRVIVSKGRESGSIPFYRNFEF